MGRFGLNRLGLCVADRSGKWRDHGCGHPRITSEREFGASGHQPLDILILPLSDWVGSFRRIRLPEAWLTASSAAAHYFGEGNWLIFRAASGQVNVLDAYCQHPRGPTWRSAAPSRANTCLPVHGLAMERRRPNAPDPVYSQDRLQAENVASKDLPVAEWYGFILVWHGTATAPRPPYWGPAPVVPARTRDRGINPTGTRITRGW